MKPRRFVSATTFSMTWFRSTVTDATLAGTRNGIPDLSPHQVSAPVNVSGLAAQHPESGIRDQVLAPVVLHESVPMVPTVVLDDQTCGRVKEVGSADESPG